MKPSDKVWWQRVGPGFWWAHLLVAQRNRTHTFTVERTSKRGWSMYDWDDSGDWVCIMRGRTWHECRVYVEEYFETWRKASNISYLTTIRAARGAKSTNANTSLPTNSNVPEYQPT